MLHLIITLYAKQKYGSYFGKGARLKGFPRVLVRGEFSVGSNVIVNSGLRYNPIGGDTRCSIIVEQGAVLRIGDNTGISNCTIFCANSITIGNNVLIGGGVKIYDTDFHSIHFENRMASYRGSIDNDISTAAVTILDGAFIGAHSLILKGVIIGKNSVVGAGSIVTKNIPDNQIWAGNPAKYIKRI